MKKNTNKIRLLSGALMISLMGGLNSSYANPANGFVKMQSDVCDDGPLAGTLTATNSILCSSEDSGIISASPNGDAFIPEGYSKIYVLTKSDNLVILQVNSSPEFTINREGIYRIHTLVYDPNTLDLGIVVLGTTTGFDVNSLLEQGGGTICASLDVAGATVAALRPLAGSLTASDFESCSNIGSTTISATPNGDIDVPFFGNFQTLFVLTKGSGLVIESVNTEPTFTVTESGDFTIHTLLYNPNFLDLGIVEFGVTTGFDVNGLLVQGGGSICGSLDVEGAKFSITNINAGTLSAENSSICASGSAILTATPNGDISIPEGYSVVYVLTEGAGLVIQQAGAEPTFTVTASGNYTIHTLVYDALTLDLGIIVPGVTTGFDVNGLLVQGGGSICASLDVAGAPISVSNPSAGTLTTENTIVCGENEPVEISATPNGDALVPAGYSTIYVLTKSDNLVIVNVNSSPIFTIDKQGVYRIHTLVYDATTLDLGIVVLGVTTGFDVNGLLVQGGGSICASLDVVGAKINAYRPLAGTLTNESSSVCLEEGLATLIATPVGDSKVPFFGGYQTLFVLTSGAELVIQAVSTEPNFDVSEVGNYTIHTLIYTPTTLDLGIVEFGVTTGFDVNGLLIQGGGSICASLDVSGAAFVVEDCNPGIAPKEDVTESKSITLYPNPANAQVAVNYLVDKDDVVVITIKNLVGKNVMKQNFTSSNGVVNTTLDLTSLPSGNYILFVEENNRISSSKLFIQK